MSETREVKKVLIDATVEADMNVDTYRWGFKNESEAEYRERHAKKLEEACTEFHDHCRDHRSLDHIQLTVVRKYGYVCPCGNEFGTEAEAKDCMTQDALDAANVTP